MVRLIPRAVIAALVGALAGAACLTLVFARNPAVAFEMDSRLPRVASGFYPTERGPSETFAWTRGRAVVELPGLDRRSEWVCLARVRGGRPAPFPQPLVEIAADGVRLASVSATNEYQDLEVTVPARPARPGLTLTLTSDPLFVPSPSDPRQLGVQVDRLICQPRTDGLVLPPRRALVAALIAGAAFGATFGLMGLSLAGALVGALLIAALLALPLASGPAPYDRYPEIVSRLAPWIGILSIAGVAILERWSRRPLHAAARFVIAFSAGVLFIKLLGLLHPLKSVIDALFHAHRFEWVLDGRFFFTQPMPDGVQFPYAIGLYVFAAPWSFFTRDYIGLLRIVVCASEAIAAASLYPMIARTWGDRGVAALAVVLFHFVPVPYVVAGNANLTYAFGESAALATMVAVAGLRLGTKDVGTLGVLFLLASLAFLSHVGIFPLLLVKLLIVAVLYRVFGDSDLRAGARTVALAATLAAVFSTVSYYGHFAEVYRSLDRVVGRVTSATVPAPPVTEAAETSESSQSQTDAEPSIAVASIHTRIGRALAHGVRNIGWPIVTLAIIGLWPTLTRRRRDRLALVLAAWFVTYLMFVGFAASAPIELRFLRYADEFIGRVNYSTMPAAVILAAYGARWAWTAGLVPRIVASMLVLLAGVGGMQQWAAWFD